MPSLSIAKVETVRGNDNVDLFDPFGDVITLRLSIDVSSDILTMSKPVLRTTYQILEFSTDQVFEQWVFDRTPSGTVLYKWLTTGTAHDLGMNWIESDIFGFRGAVELMQDTMLGRVAIDAFDVSPVHWFRVKPLFLL